MALAGCLLGLDEQEGVSWAKRHTKAKERNTQNWEGESGFLPSFPLFLSSHYVGLLLWAGYSSPHLSRQQQQPQQWQPTRTHGTTYSSIRIANSPKMLCFRRRLLSLVAHTHKRQRKPKNKSFCFVHTLHARDTQDTKARHTHTNTDNTRTYKTWEGEPQTKRAAQVAETLLPSSPPPPPSSTSPRLPHTFPRKKPTHYNTSVFVLV